MAKQKKALVLLDGSQRSLMTVDYLIQMPMFQTMKLTLYNVFSGIPESYWDLEKEPSSVHVYHEIKAWERERREKITDYMARARKKLLDSGFASSAVEIKIHDRKKGIARDILKEAEGGYATVVLRRRGMMQIEGVSMGSVATKLLSKISFLPIQIAGQKTFNDRILIGIDGSQGGLQAVDYVAENIGHHDYAIGLIHVIRGFGSTPPPNPDLVMPEDNVKTAEIKMREHFNELREKLVSAGMKSENITENIVTGAHSRAGSIVKEAETGNYSCIAVGRRGHSRVREFFMGRVCQKVVQAGKYHTVWII